jgi:hypothetical protein
LTTPLAMELPIPKFQPLAKDEPKPKKPTPVKLMR